jgi:succinate dehydrogenase / fumarate reductase membrane anchor subunit
MTPAAATGLRAWIVQRISAIYLALFIIYCLIVCAGADEFSYAAWRGWLAQPFVTIGIGLFFLALLLHIWVGVRDVLLDYIKPIGLRFTLLALLAVSLIGLGLWVVQILFVAVQS